MPIYPFTPTGIADKQADLYNNTDADLLLEARAIATDVYAWLLANFTLTTKQQTYISSTPVHIRYSWGAIISAAVNQRSLIEMESVPTNYGPPRRTKEIMIAISGDCNFFPPVSGPATTTGTIKVSVQYRLVD